MPFKDVPRGMMRVGILSLVALSLPCPSLAAGVAQNATISITDTGFNPTSVTLALGGTVIWTNNGQNIHTATTTSVPWAFDSGGLTNGQSFNFNFTSAGTYTVTSSTDCLNANSTPGFSCAPATITVVSPSAASAQAASNPAGGAMVSITDFTFVPANLTVQAGSAVTWTNMGVATHTVTALPGVAPGFDSGGLGNGQSASTTFTSPGTFLYSSAPDCLPAPTGQTFNCGVAYAVTVTAGPPPAATAAPASSAGTVASAPSGSTTVAITDNGYSPSSLTVKAGKTVIWSNRGGAMHSVVSDAGAFDSGGIAPGQSFAFTFPSPGTYAFHSSTEPVYSVAASGVVTVSYPLTGTIVVQ